MKIFTYARVSTLDQDLSVQREALEKLYPNALYFEEKRSATTMKKRVELQTILRVIGEGDKLVVWRLDRLARNMKDLMDIVSTLEERGAHLVIQDFNIDTSNPANKLFMQMLGVFAEFETNLRKERQREGIDRAKRADAEKGVSRYIGKQPNKAKHAKIRELLFQGFSPSHIAKMADTSESTVFRVKRKIKTELEAHFNAAPQV